MSLIATYALIAFPLSMGTPIDDASTWHRGNTHTHTLWSDGDAPPEHVVNWYVENGYGFLVLSDHNVMQSGEKWFAITPDGRLTPAKVEALEPVFGADWTETREKDGASEMRLRTFEELQQRFERPDEFILVPGEEVTDRYRLAEIHINALNIDSVIPPQNGDSVQETIQNNLDAITRHGEETGRSVIAHINHPNFRKSLGATNLAAMKGQRFFEVYNGHRSVENERIGSRPSTEELWDTALVMRLSEGAGDGELLYGLATDDAHDHYATGTVSIPGRGWIMVRSEELESNAIIDAMKRGDFYASSGVTLKAIDFKDGTLSIEIDEEEGVEYFTEFIGARVEDGLAPVPGQRLMITNENPAVYEMTGNELYVRARITSSRFHPRPYAEGDKETAWVQPIRPRSTPES